MARPYGWFPLHDGDGRIDGDDTEIGIFGTGTVVHAEPHFGLAADHADGHLNLVPVVQFLLALS